MSEICTAVTPGQPLTDFQKTGLEWVGRLQGGRDVVLAIDLTESVGLNDEGHIRLRQIVEDSLKSGDTVYVVPFATKVNPLEPEINLLKLEAAIQFKGKADVEKILQLIPFQANLNLQNTDVQRAELTIYQGLADLNQCRLTQNQPIKPQSVVWITDAQLFTNSPATSQEWIETPGESPFRVGTSQETQQRQQWLDKLPLTPRSLSIKTQDQQKYNLTIVDLPPTVQEFCTPTPGFKQTCLVPPYLWKQLSLPALTLVILILASIGLGIKIYHLNKKWKITINFADKKTEEQTIYFRNHQRISIGEYESNCNHSIDTPGAEIRGYLIRKGEKLYLEPIPDSLLEYNGQNLTKKTPISGGSFQLNCPYSRTGNSKAKKNYEFTIKIQK
ncbi:hypothetical protein NO976_02972 [Planktothrix agardhii]|uniref:VWA domain-containing protein n=1 Tax=Planktothrix agardhii TaxID=1160 RepID=UPI0020A6EB4F|nr:VWA domain-containing protein [Planktothrix agardhii]CAD5956508.1 hypothetical protein NO976_02972 [Planktothrix agardhii]